MMLLKKKKRDNIKKKDNFSEIYKEQWSLRLKVKHDVSVSM